MSQHSSPSRLLKPRRANVLTGVVSVILAVVGSLAIAGAQQGADESVIMTVWRALAPDSAVAAPAWARRLYVFLADARQLPVEEAPAPATTGEGPTMISHRDRPVPAAPIEQEDPYASDEVAVVPVEALPAAPARARPTLDAEDPYGNGTNETVAQAATPAAPTAAPRLTISAIEADNPYL